MGPLVYFLTSRNIANNSFIHKLDKLKPCLLKMNFCRKLLHVKRNTSTIGIRGDLGLS